MDGLLHVLWSEELLGDRTIVDYPRGLVNLIPAPSF